MKTMLLLNLLVISLVGIPSGVESEKKSASDYIRVYNSDPIGGPNRAFIENLHDSKMIVVEYSICGIKYRKALARNGHPGLDDYAVHFRPLDCFSQRIVLHKAWFHRGTADNARNQKYGRIN